MVLWLGRAGWGGGATDARVWRAILYCLLRLYDCGLMQESCSITLPRAAAPPHLRPPDYFSGFSTSPVAQKERVK